VSATYPPELLALLRALLAQPQEVLLAKDNPSLKGIRQFYARAEALDGGAEPGVAGRVQALLTLLEGTAFNQCVVL
jgi:superfamily II DNA/RNA helicase